MTSYSPVGQLTGTFSKNVNLADKLPWLYLVASLSSKVIYVGESLEDGGLLVALARHVGSLGESPMKTKALELDMGRPKSPYVVVAARLPTGDDPAGFDGASTTTREQCLATLQAKVAQGFVAKRPGWTDLTVATGSVATEGSAVDKACSTIFSHANNTIVSMTALSKVVPVHLIVLDPYPISVGETDTIEGVLSEIEVQLHGWIVGKLNAAHGASWWSKGIPEPIRTGCVTRREQDGGDHSIASDAYMMLIDLISIAKFNWSSLGPLMEHVAGRQGKDAATSWISELNDLRKTIAHPIRGKYVKLPAGSFERVIDLRNRLNEAMSKFQ